MMSIFELITKEERFALFMLHYNTSEYRGMENVYGYQLAVLLTTNPVEFKEECKHA